MTNFTKKLRPVLIALCFCALFLQFAFAGEDNTQNLNLSVARETLNGYTYQVKTDNSVMLNWEAQSDAESYTLEKSNNVGKVLSTKNISGSENSYMVKGLKPNTTYYFRIYATKDEDDIAESKPLKVTTFSKTTGYFYEKVVVKKEWPGVLITTKQATEDQIEDFNNVEEDMKPAIKYNYASSEKKLYINAFVKYAGEGKEDKFEYYKFSCETKKYEYIKTIDISYKDLISSGIKDTWSFDVKGSNYDFKPGVKFSTEVNLLENEVPNQNYIAIYVGDKDKKLKENNNYWFYAIGSCIGYIPGSAEYNYRSEHFQPRIIMPTQAQLASNPKRGNDGSIYSSLLTCPPKDSAYEYERTAAHEFGHILGLGDAYASGKRKRYSRTPETAEYVLCEKGVIKVNDGIMASGMVKNALPNDIEMALVAQSMAIKREPYSWQAFVAYTQNELSYVKSSAIKNAG